MTYKYSNIHTVGPVFSNLGVPVIPAPFRDSQFTIVLRNTGTDDATVYLISALGELTLLFVPKSNDGLVLTDMPYDIVAGGVAGQSVSSNTSVHISILQQAILPVRNIPKLPDLVLQQEAAAELATQEQIVIKI